MRTQTARERAEIRVALIRLEYPEPLGHSPRDYQIAEGRPQGWYCVGWAAVGYDRAHSDDSSFPNITWGDVSALRIPTFNNRGHFKEAWAALTNYYEDKFSQ